MIGAGGELELAIAGSTRPITQTETHARIVAATVHELRMATALPDQAMRITP